MNHFLRAHHAVTMLCCSALICSATWALAGTAVPVPQLFVGRLTPVAVELLLTAVLAPVTAHGFGGVALRLEHASPRFLWAQDVALTAVLLLPVLTIGAVAVLTGDRSFALMLTRNALTYVAITLAMLSVTTQVIATAVSITYFLLASALGAAADGSAQWWAFLRLPATTGTLIPAVVFLAAALVLFHYRARPTTARRSAPVTG